MSAAILALGPNAVVSHAVTPETPHFMIPKVHKADYARWFDMTTATRHLANTISGYGDDASDPAFMRNATYRNASVSLIDAMTAA